MPCALKDPSQHFFEYVPLSQHKHPLFDPLGDDLDGVGSFFIVIVLIE